MSGGPYAVDLVDAAKAGQPDSAPSTEAQVTKPDVHPDEKHKRSGSNVSNDTTVGPDGEIYPNQEELDTLPRKCGHIPWTVYTIAFVELCERFSYYGTTAVFVNFIQQPLPEGSTTGSAGTYGQPGALGLGQRAATALTLFNQFWAYIMPLLGAYMADTYWGRYLTIQIAIAIAMVGHVLLIIATIPPLIKDPDAAVAIFAIGLVVFGVGVGGFKSNISPLIAEQYENLQPKPTVEVTKHGKRVIIDPNLTITRIYMRFYMMINIGALIGQIAMVYAEKYVGYWLAFTLPTAMFFCCPLVMFACRNKYYKRPPTGSVLGKTMKLWAFAMKGRWSVNPARTVKNMSDPSFWETAKPSRQANKPEWMTFDDAWVDEVRRGFKACAVFVWLPVYWLAYSQMLNNLVSQAATLELNGVPNDIVNNIDPLCLIIFIPICDKFFYPALARKKIRFTPIKRITAGFFTGCLSMITAAIIQHYIYVESPCGDHANSCPADQPAPFTVWVQIPAYMLIAFSEIFALITCLEYAFTKAPKNMRSLVTAVFLFTSAISSAISQAFVSLSQDPLLVWNYTVVAILAFLGGIGFWLSFKKLDKEEDMLNALPESKYKGRGRNSVVGVEEETLQDQKA